MSHFISYIFEIILHDVSPEIFNDFSVVFGCVEQLEFFPTKNEGKEFGREAHQFFKIIGHSLYE